ncbi:MAG: hypothetical protein J3K34DRAFT_438641 [Monoraphidium minutum]|nr:MAG: hypothetical protein J3K34DRAFT_438641 [Monoraphidium minutum]
MHALRVLAAAPHAHATCMVHSYIDSRAARERANARSCACVHAWQLACAPFSSIRHWHRPVSAERRLHTTLRCVRRCRRARLLPSLARACRRVCVARGATRARARPKDLDATRLRKCAATACGVTYCERTCARCCHVTRARGRVHTIIHSSPSAWVHACTHACMQVACAPFPPANAQYILYPVRNASEPEHVMFAAAGWGVGRSLLASAARMDASMRT